MTTKENYGDKVFCQDMTDEMYRINLVSETYDFMTHQQLNSLGLPPNPRCLDIGAGTGSLAAWLAEQPELQEGEVVAMDRYTDLLPEKLPSRSNLKIIKYDIITDTAPVGQFDLVNIRFVLMHLRERAELLKKLHPG